ncbi:MAG TPA: GntR family transcriptional regulator [Candidatus Dormibacteraeota bacterium]|nr:GntR family transcriptional regulator [Candidatus Dormibacteraeota bacterium]
MKPKLDRESLVPLYQQLADRLRRDIEEGRLPAGVAFPSERKLMSRYQVTRTTVRSAIGVLKQEGMVVAEHGAGSFVRDPKADRHRVDATGVGMRRPAPQTQESQNEAPTRAFRLTGIQESTERRMPTTPWISELLQVEDGTEVLVQEATGFDSQGVPSLCRGWLHPRVEKEMGLSEEDLEGHWLPDVLAIKGVPAVEGEDVVEAAMPTPNIKQLLGLPDGVPVLQLYRVMKQEDRVVAVIETHLPADLTTLVFPRVSLTF